MCYKDIKAKMTRVRDSAEKIHNVVQTLYEQHFKENFLL